MTKNLPENLTKDSLNHLELLLLAVGAELETRAKSFRRPSDGLLDGQQGLVLAGRPPDEERALLRGQRRGRKGPEFVGQGRPET